jgi:hypothetical protein
MGRLGKDERVRGGLTKSATEILATISAASRNGS